MDKYGYMSKLCRLTLFCNRYPLQFLWNPTLVYIIADLKQQVIIDSSNLIDATYLILNKFCLTLWKPGRYQEGTRKD